MHPRLASNSVFPTFAEVTDMHRHYFLMGTWEITWTLDLL